MGKCISKNSATITLAISEKDLANATIVLSKLSTESLHYMKKLQQQQQQHNETNIQQKKSKREQQNERKMEQIEEQKEQSHEWQQQKHTWEHIADNHTTITNGNVAFESSKTLIDLTTTTEENILLKEEKVASVDAQNTNRTYRDDDDDDHGYINDYYKRIGNSEESMDNNNKQSHTLFEKHNNGNRANKSNYIKSYAVPPTSIDDMSRSLDNFTLQLNTNNNNHDCFNYAYNRNCVSNSNNNINYCYYYDNNNNDNNNNDNMIIYHNLLPLYSDYGYRNRRQHQQDQHICKYKHNQQHFNHLEYATCNTTNKLFSYNERLKKLLKRQQKLKKLHNLLALIAVTRTTTAATLTTIDVQEQMQTQTQTQTQKQIIIDDNFKCPVQMNSNDLQFQFEGQTESKKTSKKHEDIRETKGTAISFGFRKNLNTTPKKFKKFIKSKESKNTKKLDKYNNTCNDERNSSTVGSVDPNSTDTHNNEIIKRDIELNPNIKYPVVDIVSHPIERDDNGNTDVHNNVHFKKVSAATYTKNTAALDKNLNTTNNKAAPLKQQNKCAIDKAILPGVISRFGYRGPVRPSSTDITHRWQNIIHDSTEINNWNGSQNSSTNNRGILVNNLKRRSKSAHAERITSSTKDDFSNGNSRTANTSKSIQPKTIKFNLNQNSTIEYDKRPAFDVPPPLPVVSTRTKHDVNSSFSAANNLIIRPKPCTATAAFSKFTLQTVSLPKPEYAIPISIQATTPSTPGSSYASSPVMGINTGARAKEDKHNTGLGRVNIYTMNQQRSQITNPAPYAVHLDTKAAKHLVNSTTRRTFCGSREISADSGIASLDVNFDSSNSSGTRSIASQHDSPKRSRSRPRNLHMVMNGRGKFEIRNFDESLSSESSSIVEPLALPKLPSDGNTVPLPLSGLVRSNTVLSRESCALKNEGQKARDKTVLEVSSNSSTRAPSEENSESIEEEKLHLDRFATEKSIKERRFKDINTGSKTSSPGSSIILTWSNAGESLAVKDFSTLTLTSSDDSNQIENRELEAQKDMTEKKIEAELNDDDINILNTEMQQSTISSINDFPVIAKPEKLDGFQNSQQKVVTGKEIKRPISICSSVNDNKFAEMALQGSTFLLDDETSPTVSLISSTESEEAACKQKKHQINEELQEKDIDDISPELDVISPISPGTPTHASHSLSLSDCGNLIDDEIADQPALLFNQKSQDVCGGDSIASRKEKSGTPTLMESLNSMRQSVHSQTKSRSALHQAMELSLRTPLSLRKVVLERAESLDTLSPCESICSDDLIMDFDMTSSRDSMDRSTSIKSRSGSDLNKINDPELYNEFECKSSDVMKELNTLLRSHAKNKIEKDHCAYLPPARATRLLNRSRIQPDSYSLNNDDSDNSIHIHSPINVRRNCTNTTASAYSSTASSTQNNSAASSLKRNQVHKSNRNHYQHNNNNIQAISQSRCLQHSSSDDLMLYDKSFRNAIIQDVLQFKKQLLRLRHILQETETVNPFENNNKELFASCGLDSKLLDDIDLASLTSSTTDDPIQELAELRRQVVYLQSQVDERDRTIRLQKHLIDKLEANKKPCDSSNETTTTKELVNMATQTERIRPYSTGIEGLSRSKPECISYTTIFPATSNDLNVNTTNDSNSSSTNSSSNNSNSSTTTTIIHQQPVIPIDSEINGQPQQSGIQTRRHTIISTTLTNYNHQQQQQKHIIPRRASIANEEQAHRTNNYVATPVTSYKPVKITLIGDPIKHWNNICMDLNNNNSNNKHNNNNVLYNNNNKYNNNDCDNDSRNSNNRTEKMKFDSLKDHFKDIKWHNNTINTMKTIKNESYQRQPQQQHQHQQQQQKEKAKQKHEQSTECYNRFHNNNINNNDHNNQYHYQFYRTMPHYQQQQHNNLKPTVTIV